MLKLQIKALNMHATCGMWHGAWSSGQTLFRLAFSINEVFFRSISSAL